MRKIDLIFMRIMSKVTEHCYETTGHTSFMCDFSPPRYGIAELLAPAADLDVEFLSVAYNPGKSVRINSAMLAVGLQKYFGKSVVFTLATRDMNKLAIQSLLLGARLLGLQNVIAVQGDPFSERDLTQVKHVGDFTTTTLIAAIRKMNLGEDYRGRELGGTTDFCVGATVDLGGGIQGEARLARRKALAGAEFFVTQPIFNVADVTRFSDAYSAIAGEPLTLPMFVGLQVMEPGSIIFSSVPSAVREELAQGRSGVEMALELYNSFQEHGIHNVYIVPSIWRGGRRNYAAAQEVLARAVRL
jgi:5,10-methylenetetrahydrofolate reductase